ncbi:hypothetical protein HA466_0196060 [Hirschfeldia incana]|nr:hypothetical protein HA466_0196060 [Hirschfeldia incana]KAJ0243569.1 hypothetical protein HA466_0196060 [Hirschfeldia incana]KAJ0243570.1 hypothetical protein HA466_0196060 [Hirschfeldia incana]
MKQSGYDEMQLLQQQVMLKQLHALQMQQQNFSNPYSSTAQKQANSSRQFPTLLNEMPLNDSSQGYLNWGQQQQHSTPSQQGMLDRTMFSMGLGSQQPDISLYGSPVANARGNMSQAMYQEHGSLVATPPCGQSQKPLMQLSDFNNPFLQSQYASSPQQLPLQQGTFMSNLGVQGRGMSEAGSVNLLSQQFVSSPKDPSGRQEEQVSWSSFQQKDTSTTKLSQGLVPLDPLEEKILFSMEDSGSISEIASGVFGDTVNFSSPFPSSMQSGSWSALMQTAVAEASSSDTVLPEEFSGLTYQNMEISADINDISNFIDSDKQQSGFVNTNTLLGSSSLNSSFPGFQVPSNQLRPGLFQDDSPPVSTQRSSNVTGHWVDCNPQPKISTGNMYMQSSGMFDQLQSQTGIHRSSPAPSHLAGMSSLVPRQLGQAGMFPKFMQQNDPSTVSVSQMQTTNPFVASFSGNATLPGVNLDPGLGGHTTRSPQRGTNQQFNVWMDLPTRQHLLEQESIKVPGNILESDVTTWQKAQQMSSTGYNMQQSIGLPQEQGAAAKNISDFTASNKDFNKLPMDSGMSSELKSFTFPGPMMQPAHESQEIPDQSPQHSKPLGTTNKHAEIIAPKKRKLVRTKKLAWHEEVSNTSQRDHTISESEQEWARVANFLSEKAEYDTRTFEFAPPMHRSKRRLVISSQLMQQLFDPPPSPLLLSKASSSYDVLCFFIARTTLGDACSLTHKRENVSPSSSYETDKIPKKSENFESKDVQVAKSLTEQANKLKESFERLKKTQSMAEIKFDIEDLERFSVINRFARFHSKGPASGPPALPKPMPQRYVAVGPMPRIVPEGVQCISL